MMLNHNSAMDCEERKSTIAMRMDIVQVNHIMMETASSLEATPGDESE